MASGTLGQSAPSASTNTSVYTVPAGKIATFSINVCNRDQTTPVLVNIGICASSSPANAEYIEYNVPIPTNGVLERTGLVASAGKIVVVWASSANTSVNVYGYEE